VVKNLYSSKNAAPSITAALQELIGARITDVLPSLQNIFVERLRVEPSGPLGSLLLRDVTPALGLRQYVMPAAGNLIQQYPAFRTHLVRC